METVLRPISTRRLAELRGYVAWGIMLFRSILGRRSARIWPAEWPRSTGWWWCMPPASKILFGIKPGGDKLTPSARRPPFTWDESKRYRAGMVNFGFLDVPFAELKSAADRKISGP